MSEGKSALGRGLGHLLKSAEPPPASTQTGGQSSTVTPGMAALLRVDQEGKPASSPAANNEPKLAGADPGPSSAAAPPAEVPFTKWMFRVSLIFADLLLFGLAAWLILKGGHPLSWLQLALCILAVAMGAWLTCLGLWWGRR
jgi:hypothetical protein